MTRTLIVNADDFGRTRGVSAGIVHAHLHGLVTTTTAMVNLPGALQDVAQASHEAPTLGLGLHLNLTCGRPLLDPADVPSLVAPDGSFHTPDALIASGHRPEPAHVEREWRAQIGGIPQNRSPARPSRQSPPRGAVLPGTVADLSHPRPGGRLRRSASRPTRDQRRCAVLAVPERCTTLRHRRGMDNARGSRHPLA